LSATLTANRLCLIRGDRCLFKDLAFSLQAGELLVVEGPNGSGKTSLIRGVAGLLDFESGAVEWNGVPVRDCYQAFRAELAWFAHRVGFKGDLTMAENLDFESGLRLCNDHQRAAVIGRLGMASVVNLPFRALSAGQQRRAALARVLLSSASLWMIDEPFTNLDTEGQALVRELIEGHLDAGGLCVVATHQPLEIGACTRRLALQ